MESGSRSVVHREARRAIFDRVARSKTFSRAARLVGLLQYLGEASQDETRLEGLTEHQIGMRVFGRPESYNPMEDNIVRSSARLLRQKLEEYYKEEGARDPVRISIPRGRYVPELVSLDAAPLPAIETAPLPPTRRHWFRYGAGGVAAAAAAAGALRYRSDAGDPLSSLWSHLLDPKRRTIVILSDTAYVLAQDALETAIPVEEYFNTEQWNRWATKAAERSGISTLGYRRYTGVVDAEFALRVARRPEARNVEVLVRFARDLSVQDARGANLLVLGAPHANPWISLLDRHANFRINLDFGIHKFHVENRKPLLQEPSHWTADELRRVYGLASFLPKPDGDGHVLLLEGATIAGTETAKDLVLNPSRFTRFRAKIQPGSAAVPHFESVWQTTSLAGTSPAAELVAWRTAAF